jgi:hypothetical protein
MKKVIWAILLAAALFLVNPLSGYAGHTRVVVGANIAFGYPVYWGPHPWWGPRYYWGGPVVLGPWYPYYYPSPYYPAPPVVVQQEPPVYTGPAPAQADYYWYYCQNPPGYYPYVKTCPGGWMKVVPQTTPPPK